VRRSLVLLVGLLTAVGLSSGLLGGCTGTEPTDDPRAVLADAKKRLDTAKTVRFQVSSAGLPKSGAVLVGGTGVAKRPASFSGRFRLSSAGAAVSLDVVSLDGTMYAELPFTDRFVSTDPADLGMPDPADLLDPRHGLSSFLTRATKVRTVGESRSGREVLRQVSGTLPAKAVDRILFVADPNATLQASFYVTGDGSELRKAVFRGPFYGKRTQTTYTVVMDRYDEPATITKPG
jgi:lipoprotein LprG